MLHSARTTDEYLATVEEPGRDLVKGLVALARSQLQGVEEMLDKVGVSFVVPLSRYPDGYHCTPGEPLPLITIARQVRHVAVYHMGIYALPGMADWWTEAWERSGQGRLDMGKCCIRLKPAMALPEALFAELFARTDVEAYIGAYVQSRAEAEASGRRKR